MLQFLWSGVVEFTDRECLCMPAVHFFSVMAYWKDTVIMIFFHSSVGMAAELQDG
jgi:hypothetical protein